MSNADLANRFRKWLKRIDIQHVRKLYSCLCQLPDSTEFLEVHEVKNVIRDVLGLEDGDI